MITGIVVSFALFAILNITTDQTSRLTNYAQATQQGRLAMTKIVDALHSACVTNGFAPIQTGSGESELRFVNAYSEEAVIPKEAFNRQKIVWNKAARNADRLHVPGRQRNQLAQLRILRDGEPLHRRAARAQCDPDRNGR